MAGKSTLREDVNATVLEVGIETLVGLPVVYVKMVYVVILETERAAVLLGLDDTDWSVSMGWFNSRLQTRLTNLSGDTPFLCSANFSGNDLIKEMML